MNDDVELVLTFAAALGCGLVAGVFFAFSTFVMRGLAELPPPQGIAAMQSINRAAPRPAFMIALFGTAVLCAVVAGRALAELDDPGAGLRVAGGVVYVVGAIVLTIVYHVPRNDRLGGLDPASDGAAGSWRTYATSWTAWNHVRAASSLVAAGLLTGALRAAA
jgi:uncharacterized membrane protein